MLKRLFVVLLSAFIGCWGSCCAAINIVLTDQHSHSKDQVIENLLELQRSLVVPVNEPIPTNYQETGFLLVPMTSEYVHTLLEEKEGIIVCATQDQTLLGYILLTHISEFEELYEKLGYIEGTSAMQKLEAKGYIEQIGVRPSYARQGIGTLLINACKRLKPDGLVADVFIDPVVNRASLRFFEHAGFKKSGMLYQYPRKTIPFEHRTQIFIWKEEMP